MVVNLIQENYVCEDKRSDSMFCISLCFISLMGSVVQVVFVCRWTHACE
jgi:hypothetical protein